MSAEKPTRYIVFGAGAIGGAIAGLLSHTGSRVVCVARPAQAEAIRRGIVIKRDEEEISTRADAVTSVKEISPQSGDVIFITTKSQATREAVEELSSVYGEDAPVVCLQNGVRNEAVAAQRFNKIYAGLLFLSAVQLKPDLLTLPRGRAVAVGCYPGGVDDTSKRICDDLARAGFEATASAHVMAMKHGKLVANLNNATFAITGYWLERGMSDPDMRELTLEVREEGLRVLDAAGVPVEPPDGEPSPIRIRELTEKLKRAPKETAGAADLPEEQRTYPSMWQDLYLGRKSNEAEFLNGDIVALGKKMSIPTPYNSTLLEVANRMFAEGLKPGLYTPSELHALIKARGLL